MNPPAYFAKIEAKARAQWRQLDDDPELAAPWRQLFSQVQSPRHVLSELLQNADDAQARCARVSVRQNLFIFEHDGEDFTAEQLESLCRFGFSNKRNLHTIGFRGIGFKSTFSLGHPVRIQTPTLDLSFAPDRFTLPVWNSKPEPSPLTRITVRIQNPHCLTQLRKNLEEWATSPASLLFFNSLQELSIESHVISKEILSAGPIPRSFRMRLKGAHSQDVLLIRSEEESFPPEVMDEVRRERNAADLNLPPCRVDIVLGLAGKQRVFVVLPTGAEVSLPFSINAPFIQDPGRFSIKEPEVNACNRWLLERAGRLAGNAIRAWLNNDALSTKDRAGAYRLLRGPLPPGADLSTAVSQQVLSACIQDLRREAFLLTTENSLINANRCVALPFGLYGIWEDSQLAEIFANKGDHLLAAEVGSASRDVLVQHGWIKSIAGQDVLNALMERPVVPKPASFDRLQKLWEWVEEESSWMYGLERKRSMRIVPVEGESILQPACDVIRVSARREQLSDADWQFISNFALTLDRDWIAHLAKLRTKGRENEDIPELELLQELGLHEPSSVDRIAILASRRLFLRTAPSRSEYVRIAQIFAALDAFVPEDFRYVTEDDRVRAPAESPVILDPDGEVELLVPKYWASQHILHSDYVASFASCSRDRWYAWAFSSKSRLAAFVPFAVHPRRFTRRADFELFLSSRGGQQPKEYRFRNDNFVVEDRDFALEISNHWKHQAAGNPELWSSVAKAIIRDPLSSWRQGLEITVKQVSAQRTTSNLSCGNLVPAWLIYLRSVPCLPDTHGIVRAPAELLLRTPETESLIGIEPFVAADLDDSPDKKKLLRLLGVRENAADWRKIVDRLRTLSKIKDISRYLSDVFRLYEALDRISLRCSPEEVGKLRAAFAAEALVLSNNLEWFTSGEISLQCDPDDNAPVVHSASHTLALWLRLGVPERPALERGIQWLKSISPGTRLDSASYRRVNSLLGRAGRKVWDEVCHWLSLDQTWEPVGGFKYRVSMQNLVRWENLSASTKRATADLRVLSTEAAMLPPFGVIPLLSDAVSQRVSSVQRIGHAAGLPTWLNALAEGFARIKLSDESHTGKLRKTARRLLKTKWQKVHRVEVTPYVDGVPAGEPAAPNVVWNDNEIYIKNIVAAKMYKELRDELARPFNENSIADAIGHCIERAEEFVLQYLESNFTLDAQVSLNFAEEETKTQISAPQDQSDGNQSQEDNTDQEPVSDTAAEQDEADPNAQADLSALNGTEEAETSAPKPKPKELSFMDRFARSRGFRWHEAEKRYFHADERWMERTDAPFNWAEHAPDRGILTRYWISEQDLASGVEIAAELWTLLGIQPVATAVVIRGVDGDGEPVVLSGEALLQMKDLNTITIYPAKYRLVENRSEP